MNLFSDLVSDEIKTEIVEKLLLARPPKMYSFGAQPSAVPLPESRDEGMQVCVSDFVGHGSLFIFDQMGFEKDWLKEPIHSWKEIPSYLEMQNYVKKIFHCKNSYHLKAHYSFGSMNDCNQTGNM